MPKKTKNNWILHLADSVYKQDPAIYVGPYSEFRKYLKKKYEVEISEASDGNLLGGETWALKRNGRFQTYIWLANWDSTYNAVSCLMHECIHAAMGVLRMVGVPVTVDEHETLAYYASAIFTEAHMKLDKAFPLKKKRSTK